MASVAKGDIIAYDEIVRRHLPDVYRLACRMLGDRHEAEDVAQDCFARLWQSAPGWRSIGGGLAAWLRRVGSNLCLDRLRVRTRWDGGEVPEVPDPARSADRVLEQDELEDTLDAALQALSGRQRAAIVLTYWEAHPNKVAAGMLDMDLKAFESLLLRARQRLGVLLAQTGLHTQDLELLA